MLEGPVIPEPDYDQSDPEYGSYNGSECSGSQYNGFRSTSVEETPSRTLEKKKKIFLQKIQLNLNFIKNCLNSSKCRNFRHNISISCLVVCSSHSCNYFVTQMMQKNCDTKKFVTYSLPFFSSRLQ